MSTPRPKRSTKWLLALTVLMVFLIGARLFVAAHSDDSPKSDAVNGERAHQAIGVYVQNHAGGRMGSRELEVRDSAIAAYVRGDFDRVHRIVDGPNNDAYVQDQVDLIRSHVRSNRASPRERALAGMPLAALRDSILADRGAQLRRLTKSPN
ncbi:MAG TPA: hypothetical protein VJO33_15080 [Gemmatimonadaceae bacterium]|nr:hypothetical protein [Gemmatimonadaceae bacterium]